ncbi:alpha/beta hydrolase [Massilia sp. MB5]|uniref:alpha/beta fold hydrolase n=1 Tax=Massilia sp. MB5 TaxID=2919578 RepID=UPI001F0CF52F|nr:alpha/beta hydrolase [Massilia sp. MB5]UMR29996.1 alpha/beta hydrolase [Massilia sp. MB5]
MKRRHFLQLSGTALAANTIGRYAVATPATAGDAADSAAFLAARRFAELSFGRIAYVERGAGPAALFLHGAPLNGFQWRGAIARLDSERRCIVPDFMGLGYSEIPAQQPLTAGAQCAMLVALLDQLKVEKADVIASDSGGAVAQLLAARHPERVRSLLLSNCDTEPNSPPKGVLPVIEMARAGTLADDTAKWLSDPALARATFGAAVFHDPSRFTKKTIAYYVEPLVSSPLRRAQYHAFHVALDPNPLTGIESVLRRSRIPVRMVWGASDTIFPLADAEYLHRIFPRSQGIRRIPEGKLFFQEEFPGIIAEEARRLWQLA